MPINYALYPVTGDEKWKGDPDVSITGSGFAVPRGIEAVLSYNGLVMNDLTVYDKYRVTGIDGLDDADIRDSREIKYGEAGEDSWMSYYGGRSIVLKVRIEAFQLDKLRDMEEALRTAFVNMEELPLYFLTGDSERDHYINVKKNASLQKAEDVEQYKDRFFRDWQINLRASDPRFYRSRKKLVVQPVTVADPELNPYKSMELAGDIDHYEVSSDAGSFTSGVSTDWSGDGTKSLKIDSTSNVDSTKIIFTTVSDDVSPSSNYTVSAWCRLVRDNEGYQYTNITPVIVWLDVYDNLLGWVEGYTYNYINSGTHDFIYWFSGNAPANTAKINLQIRIHNNYDTYRFYADGMSIRYTTAYSTSDPISVVNVGNFETEPIITLYGEMNNPQIWNDNAPEPYNNIKFKSGTTIDEGDYRRIDIKNRTIVDSSGVNKFDEIDLTSHWLKLYSGDNPVYLSAGTTFGTSTESKFSLSYRDAWI